MIENIKTGENLWAFLQFMQVASLLNANVLWLGSEGINSFAKKINKIKREEIYM